MRPGQIKMFLPMIALVFSMVWPTATHAEGTDIYLVYSADVRSMKNDLKKTLSPTYLVKSYNVGLLSIADYSGRQKIMAKLANARVIVLVGLKSAEAFSEGRGENIVKLNAGAPDAAQIINAWFENHVMDNPVIDS